MHYTQGGNSQYLSKKPLDRSIQAYCQFQYQHMYQFRQHIPQDFPKPALSLLPHHIYQPPAYSLAMFQKKLPPYYHLSSQWKRYYSRCFPPADSFFLPMNLSADYQKSLSLQSKPHYYLLRFHFDFQQLYSPH